MLILATQKKNRRIASDSYAGEFSQNYVSRISTNQQQSKDDRTKDVTEEYEVTQKRVKDHFGAPIIDYGSGSFGTVSCCIPIDGKRLTVGGAYKAAGGRHGYKGITPGKRYKINAHILKSALSTMPEEMKH